MRIRLFQVLLVAVILVSTGVSFGVVKYYRSFEIGYDASEWFRYLNESNDTVGSVPLANFNATYLEAIFGDNPELLAKLKSVVGRGLESSTKLTLTRVSGMLVTYRSSETGEISDVATHIIGDMKHGVRRPGFHRDGYFKHLIDRNLWNIGNSIIGFIGRDIIFFAEEDVRDFQVNLIESLYTGELDYVIKAIEQPYSYTLIIPNPRKMLPPQLRHHVQTVIVKGTLEKTKGNTEFVALCSNNKSAEYTAAVITDLKQASETILRTKFGGIIEEKPWGTEESSWWAYEMVRTSEASLIKHEQNIVRVNSGQYGRVMVNAILKCFERLGRDLRQIRGSLEHKLDPRKVDADMATQKGSHYWTERHRWGPNWPIGAVNTDDEELSGDVEDYWDIEKYHRQFPRVNPDGSAATSD